MRNHETEFGREKWREDAGRDASTVMSDSSSGEGNWSSPLRSDSKGFTLLELVLATFIASMVVGILAVSLSFSLRVWERQQNRKPLNTPNIVELFKWQMAQFHSQPINVEGQSLSLLMGDKQSITFATDHSVKAISKGAPIIARYVFVPKEKKLFYTELPFDPYHAKTFLDLNQLKPGKEKGASNFYYTDIEDFSLSYSGEEKKTFEDSWDGQGAPSGVLLRWTPLDDTTHYSYVVYPNFLLSVKREGTKKDESVLKTPRERLRERRRSR